MITRGKWSRKCILKKSYVLGERKLFRDYILHRRENISCALSFSIGERYRTVSSFAKLFECLLKRLLRGESSVGVDICEVVHSRRRSPGKFLRQSALSPFYTRTRDRAEGFSLARPMKPVVEALTCNLLGRSSESPR